MKKTFLVSLMLLGMVCMSSTLYAQKPITDMTKSELNALSDAQVKKAAIKEWSGILSYVIRGVKFDDRIVEAFADNFKAGAMAWCNKEKWATVDYVVADDLVSFCRHYMGRNSCKATVMDYHERAYPVSIERAWYRIMDATDVLYRKQQAGLLSGTPPETIDAKALIDSLEP